MVVALFSAAILAGWATPAWAAHSLYVTNTGSNNVSAYSIAAGGGLSPIGGSPFAAVTNPVGVVVTPDGAHAYVVNGGGTVSAFTIGANGALSAVSGSPFSTGGSKSTLIAVTPDGRHLYVSNGGSSNVSAFSINSDGSLGAVAGSPFPTDGTGPTALAVTPDGTHLYVSNETSGTIAAFSIAGSGALTPVTGSPFTSGGKSLAGMAVTPDGRHLYLADETSNGVLAFAIGAGGTLTAVAGSPFPTGGTSPGGVATTGDGSRLYVVNQGSSNVSALSIATNGGLTPVTGSPFATGTDPVEPAVTPDGRNVYVNNAGSNDVSAFATTAGGGLTPVTGSPFAAGNGPDWLAVTPDRGPVAAFTATGARASKASEFDASGSHDRDANITRYDWSFGDGTTALNAGATPSHTYKRPGRYMVTLTVTDAEGCSTHQTFTGQSALCNGGPKATTTGQVVVGKVPGVKITKMTLGPRSHLVTFKFKALGKVSRLECALVNRGKRGKPHFSKCTSPKSYKKLKPGHYTFEVRAVLGRSAGAVTTRKFKIVATRRPTSSEGEPGESPSSSESGPGGDHASGDARSPGPSAWPLSSFPAASR